MADTDRPDLRAAPDDDAAMTPFARQTHNFTAPSAKPSNSLAPVGGARLHALGSGAAMQQTRSEIVAWVGSQVLPHERDLRAWLRKSGTSPADIDDIVQEAYCRLAGLTSVAHIASGRAYLFQTARNVAAERVRRARVIRIDYATEIDALNILDSEPSPERVVDGRRELIKVQRLIEGLPERCREIFKLRRIHGLSQREVSNRLNVTENVVEAQAARGLRLILAALAAEAGADTLPQGRPVDERPNRKRGR